MRRSLRNSQNARTQSSPRLTSCECTTTRRRTRRRGRQRARWRNAIAPRKRPTRCSRNCRSSGSESQSSMTKSIKSSSITKKKLEVELDEVRRDATSATTNNGNIVQMAMDVSCLQEEPTQLGEDVGSLDHIIEGFQPLPLDFQRTAQIEQVVSI